MADSPRAHPEDETRDTRSAGGVVLSAAGRVAVVYQTTASWSLPKGHVESAESLVDAARREILEETGLVVGDPERELGTYQRKSGRDPTERKTITIYLFLVEGEPVLRPTDQNNPSAAWVWPADALVRLTYPQDRDFLERVLREL